MINVRVKYTEDEILSITIKGHAYSNEPGRDLVCAGVSAVSVGALNSLEDSDTSFKIVIEEGNIEIYPLHRLTHKNQVVLEVLLTSLATIETSYKKYIIIIKER